MLLRCDIKCLDGVKNVVLDRLLVGNLDFENIKIVRADVTKLLFFFLAIALKLVGLLFMKLAQ